MRQLLPLEAERNFIASIIARAVEDAQADPSQFKSKCTQGQVACYKRAALCWLFSKDTRPCSLIWYCNLIDLNPDYVIRKLKAIGITEEMLSEPIKRERGNING